MTRQAADRWHAIAAGLKLDTGNFIDGEFRPARSGATFPSVNPATGAVIAQLPRSEQGDVDDAVAAAQQAFRRGDWSRIAPRDRMEILYRFADLMAAHADEFAAMDTLDMGKPISLMTEFDVPDSIYAFRYLAEAIDKVDGAVTATDPAALHYMIRQPLGVVGCISPWNYPLAMATWKVAPALAAGNTVVLKPAEQSPLSANLLARLFAEAGGPPGVFNVVHGYGEEAGRPLALHGDVAKISFTGSAEVGRLMFRYAGESNMKRVSTECGGKSPQIIFSDTADLDRAVEYAVHGIFGNQGQVCNAGSRIFVEASVFDAFVQRFEQFARATYQPGDPMDPDTMLGPMVDSHQQSVVERYLDLGVEEGAEHRCLGEVPSSLAAGCYQPASLFLNVNNDMRIAREEIFGPVACVMPFEDADDATRMANDSLYGLAASIWTSDLNTAHRMARDLESGIVWVNCFDHLDMTMPWGGWKQSGHGRDKCIQSLIDHTQSKSVWIDLS